MTAKENSAFVTFDTVRVDSAETAGTLLDLLGKEIRDRLANASGCLLARGHVSTAGTTVVLHERWATEADYRASFPGFPCDTAVPADITARPGVRSVAAFRGIELAGIDGPDAGRRPGVVSVATRHVDDRDAAHAVGRLLLRSGDWKRHFPGFVGAAAYLSEDGRTYVNYPQWMDEDAYLAYMADPRIAEGQAEIASFEIAEPEFVLCRVVGEEWSAR